MQAGLSLLLSLSCLCLVQVSTQQAGNADSCTPSAVEAEAAEAFWRLGQAVAAETGHPDQDNMQAAKVCCLWHSCITLFLQTLYLYSHECNDCDCLQETDSSACLPRWYALLAAALETTLCF